MKHKTFTTDSASEAALIATLHGLKISLGRLYHAVMFFPKMKRANIGGQLTAMELTIDNVFECLAPPKEEESCEK